MRILCDQNVPKKYLHALRNAENITVSTVRDELAPDASDGEIAASAEANDWVLLTNDDDFYADRGDHGFLYYSQVENPSPGGIVRAIRTIDGVYVDNAGVLETVPDGWI